MKGEEKEIRKRKRKERNGREDKGSERGGKGIPIPTYTSMYFAPSCNFNMHALSSLSLSSFPLLFFILFPFFLFPIRSTFLQYCTPLLFLALSIVMQLFFPFQYSFYISHPSLCSPSLYIPSLPFSLLLFFPIPSTPHQLPFTNSVPPPSLPFASSLLQLLTTPASLVSFPSTLSYTLSSIFSLLLSLGAVSLLSSPSPSSSPSFILISSPFPFCSLASALNLSRLFFFFTVLWDGVYA